MALNRAHSYSRNWLATLAEEIEWPTETERDLQRALLASRGIGDVYLAVVAWVDVVKQ